ncbi:hypothetical protein VP01_2152g2 [Puccinia sorghi]|uniref:Uncharacterized protein n=1 Tax=Puccinia sorghi TaxID=27349 RepID=A0A0L6V9M9_9BASI|nr:hypothetical protein VP01_2152g2 [Puccinia sorghi]
MPHLISLLCLAFDDQDFASQNQLINNKRTTECKHFTHNQLIQTSHCKQGFCACSHCLKSGHSEDNCYQKYPDKQHTKTLAPSMKGHSSHLTQYTPEDEETLEYLQQKYPALHL